MADSRGGSEFKEILVRIAELQQAVTGNRPPVIPLIDPTANVLSLVAAAIARQDDLRSAENKRQDDLRTMTDRCIHEIEIVRQHALADLAAAESKRIDALALAEKSRIDALIKAQESAVSLANEKSAAQAATLAAQDQSRTQNTAQQISTMRDSLEKRLQLVEQNQYQSGGQGCCRPATQSMGDWHRDWHICCLRCRCG
jgi:hypothetical protein